MEMQFYVTRRAENSYTLVPPVHIVIRSTDDPPIKPYGTTLCGRHTDDRWKPVNTAGGPTRTWCVRCKSVLAKREVAV